MSPAAERERPAALITDSTPTYRLGRFLTWTLLRVWNRARVEGLEHLPAEGAALIVANHQSFLDIPLVAGAARPRHVCFVARESLAESRFLAFVMRESGAVLVRRGQADRVALDAMLGHLRAGDLVCVYPEGTRTRDGSVGEFRGGALVAARRAGVPVVPAGIRGLFEALPRGAVLPRPRPVGIRFGPPVDPRAPGALEEIQSSVERLAEAPPRSA